METEIDVGTVGGRCVIRMAGRFTSHCQKEFLDAVERAVTESAGEILIDLDRVDYLDSTALGLLLQARDRANGAGKKVVLANAHDSVMKILEISKFDRIFGMVVYRAT